jgi:hypothetical protein
MDDDVHVDGTQLLNQPHLTGEVVFWTEAPERGTIFPVVELDVLVAKGKEQTIRIAMSKEQVDRLRSDLDRIPHFDK